MKNANVVFWRGNNLWLPSWRCMFNGQRGVSCCLREPHTPSEAGLKTDPRACVESSNYNRLCQLFSQELHGWRWWVAGPVDTRGEWQRGLSLAQPITPKKESEGGKKESIKHTIMEDMGPPTDSLVSGWVRFTHTPQLYRRATTMQDGSDPVWLLRCIVKRGQGGGVAGFWRRLENANDSDPLD